MEIKLIKTETNSYKLFKSFIDGKTLPESACERIIQDLTNKDFYTPYKNLVEQVKNKLHYSKVTKEENVIFVKYHYLDAEEERPVLIRMINIHYGAGYFIVVNNSELVYVPAESTITLSKNELSDWLSEVAGKHLTRTKMSKRKQVRLSFVALLQGER